MPPPDGESRPAEEVELRAVVVEPESDLDGHLPVRHLSVGEMTTDLGHLEPVDVAKRLVRAAHRVADRVVDTVGRGAHDLGDSVDVLGHQDLLLFGVRGTRPPAAAARAPRGRVARRGTPPWAGAS